MVNVVIYNVKDWILLLIVSYSTQQSILTYLNFFKSLVGCTVHVPTLEGHFLPMQYTEIITPTTEKRIPQRGLPIPRSGNERGNLIVRFKVKFPDRLDNNQKSALNSILP